MNKKIIFKYINSYVTIWGTLQEINPRAYSMYEDGWSKQHYLDNPKIIVKTNIGDFCVQNNNLYEVPQILIKSISEIFDFETSDTYRIIFEWFNESVFQIDSFSYDNFVVYESKIH